MNTNDFNKANISDFTYIMGSVRNVINNALESSASANIMEEIHINISMMESVSFYRRTENRFYYTTSMFDFMVEDNLDTYGTVCVTPSMSFVTDNSRGAVKKMTNDKFILIKIDCKRLNDCDWSRLFKYQLKDIAALNIDNFKYELGSSCWWDGRKNQYTYVLISKEAVNDMQSYIDNDREEYFNHNGKVEYLLYKNYAKVGFIWNDDNAKISFDGDLIFDNGEFTTEFIVLDYNYEIGF